MSLRILNSWRSGCSKTVSVVSIGQVELRALLSFSMLFPEQHEITVEGALLRFSCVIACKQLHSYQQPHNTPTTSPQSAIVHNSLLDIKSCRCHCDCNLQLLFQIISVLIQWKINTVETRAKGMWCSFVSRSHCTGFSSKLVSQVIAQVWTYCDLG